MKISGPYYMGDIPLQTLEPSQPVNYTPLPWEPIPGPNVYAYEDTLDPSVADYIDYGVARVQTSASDLLTNASGGANRLLTDIEDALTSNVETTLLIFGGVFLALYLFSGPRRR